MGCSASGGMCRDTLLGLSHVHLSENNLEFRALLAGVVTSGLIIVSLSPITCCCCLGTLRLVF